MHAAAQGAAGVGGTVIGVTCSAFKNSVANEYVTREIVTASLEERLDTLVEIGQGYVVLPGGTGTLLELATVWELKNKGFLDRGKPIVLAGGFWRPLVESDGEGRSGLREAGGLRRKRGTSSGLAQKGVAP